ncbi:MAG: hypothetical protein PHG66_04740 [Candidatus Colwellbacteria bacterium]|nr:hypothetical protein [Candidatus Colwellbacteria bacterium]
MSNLSVRSFIAIDAGGVLLHLNEGVDQSNRSRTPVKGANEVLAKLKSEGHKLFLVSFAGRKTAEITFNDMKEHYNGLLDGLFFVKNKEEKIALCRYLGADVMIDDTSLVHYHIKNGIYTGKPKAIGGVPSIHRLQFTGAPFGGDKSNLDLTGSDGATVVETWDEIYNICSGLTHTHKPDDKITITKYVYPEHSSV